MKFGEWATNYFIINALSLGLATIIFFIITDKYFARRDRIRGNKEEEPFTKLEVILAIGFVISVVIGFFVAWHSGLLESF